MTIIALIIAGAALGCFLIRLADKSATRREYDRMTRDSRLGIEWQRTNQRKNDSEL